MPLIIFLHGRKNAQTSQKSPSPENVMQCFRSSRGDGDFCQIGHRLNFKPIFSIIESHTLRRYHLRICSLREFVIFYDITGFQRRGFLQIQFITTYRNFHRGTWSGETSSERSTNKISQFFKILWLSQSIAISSEFQHHSAADNFCHQILKFR